MGISRAGTSRRSTSVQPVLRRVLRRLGVLAAAVLVVGLPATAAAHAADPPPLGLRLSAPVAGPGAGLLVSGTGFSNAERVDLYVGTTHVGAVTADSSGAFTGARFTVPATTASSDVPVVANGRYSRFTTSATLTVRSSWAQAGFDATHAGFNSTETGLNSENVGSIDSADTAFLLDRAFPPVEAYNLVYYLSRGGILAVSELGNRDPRFSRDIPVSGGASVAAGLLYLWSGHTLYALDAGNGKTQWTNTTLRNTDAGSAPVYADGTLFITRTGSGAGAAAVDAKTGVLKWTQTSTSGQTLDRPPTVGGGLVYVRVAGGGTALDETTGAVRWTHAVVGSGDGTLALSSTTLVAPSKNGTTALDVRTGAVRWTDARAVNGDAAVANGRVYLAAHSAVDDSYQTVAIDAATGAQRWAEPQPSSTPAVANGLVYVADGGLSVFAADTGKVVSRRMFPNEETYGGVVVVNSSDFLPSIFSYQGVVQGYHVNRFVSMREDITNAEVSVDDSGSPPHKINYSTGWASGSHTGAFGDGFHYTRTAGASATFTFSGSGVRLWYSTAAGFGQANVIIDGRTVARLDLSSSVRRDGIKSWTSSALARGSHTVVLRAVDTRVVDLDRIDLGFR